MDENPAILTVEDYLASVPEEKRSVFSAIRETIKSNLPAGFEETLSYGMLGYVVPLARYPQGYRPGKGTALPLMALAAQKRYISLYHLGLYSDPEMLEWFVGAYAALNYPHALDMGKSCIRFKYLDEVPLALIARLAGKISMEAWIARYEASLSSLYKGGALR